MPYGNTTLAIGTVLARSKAKHCQTAPCTRELRVELSKGENDDGSQPLSWGVPIGGSSHRPAGGGDAMPQALLQLVQETARDCWRLGYPASGSRGRPIFGGHDDVGAPSASMGAAGYQTAGKVCAGAILLTTAFRYGWSNACLRLGTFRRYYSAVGMKPRNSSQKP